MNLYLTTSPQEVGDGGGGGKGVKWISCLSGGAILGLVEPPVYVHNIWDIPQTFIPS